jgi:hypothetical protein
MAIAWFVSLLDVVSRGFDMGRLPPGFPVEYFSCRYIMLEGYITTTYFSYLLSCVVFVSVRRGRPDFNSGTPPKRRPTLVRKYLVASAWIAFLDATLIVASYEGMLKVYFDLFWDSPLP